MCDGFEWDQAKSDDCFRRRGFDFSAATLVFQGRYVERYDDEHSGDEDRWIVTGLLYDMLIDVIYTWREDQRRIISAFASGSASIVYFENAYGR